MAKARGKYGKSAKIGPTDLEIVDNLLERLNAKIAEDPDLRADFLAMRNASPAVRMLIMARLMPVRIKKAGRPRRMLPDDLVLDGLEHAKTELASFSKTKITDRQAAKYCLENGYFRPGGPDAPYNRRPATKQEIDVLIATMGRARKARKSKKPPAK